MNQSDFARQSVELEAWSKSLASTATSMVSQARDIVEGRTQPSDPSESAEQWAEICLRNVAKRIGDCMSAYDATIRSLGFSSCFEPYFNWEKMEHAAEEGNAAAMLDSQAVREIFQKYRSG